MQTNIDSARLPFSSVSSHAWRFRIERERFHVALSYLNRTRLLPATPRKDFPLTLERMRDLVLAERRFLESERHEVSVAARSVPKDPARFAAWFEDLRNGPGQFDPLFDSIAEKGSFEQARRFLRRDIANQVRFDDLVALAQVRMPEAVKLTLTQHYWGEVERREFKQILGRLAELMDVATTSTEAIEWESLAPANMLVGFAYSRRYAFQAIGAIGAVELTSSTRAPRILRVLDRLDVPKSASDSLGLHAIVGSGHWQRWRDNIAIPLVAAFPDAAANIAEGALALFNASARMFRRYREHLGVSAERAQIG